MTEPTHPQAPPTHPGPMPTPNPVRRPWAAHAIIAVSPPVIAWLAPAALIDSPVPVLLFLFMLPPFGLVFLIEVLRPKQSLLRHAALVIAPGVLMTWMVLIIMASTSSTAAIGFIFAPIYSSLAAGAAYGIVSVVEFVIRRQRSRKRGHCVKCGYDLRGHSGGNSGGSGGGGEVCPECGVAAGTVAAANG